MKTIVGNPTEGVYLDVNGSYARDRTPGRMHALGELGRQPAMGYVSDLIGLLVGAGSRIPRTAFIR